MDQTNKRQRNMYGAVNGVTCKIYTHTEYHGGQHKRSVEFTNFEAYFPQSLNMGLLLKKEGAVLGKIAKMMGSQDIQIGDPGFDACFTIKGMDENQIRTFLTNERRQSIMSVRQTVLDLQISDLGISWTVQSNMFDPNTIPFYITQFVQLADAIYPQNTNVQFQ
jgi:hypothetical protein